MIQPCVLMVVIMLIIPIMIDDLLPNYPPISTDNLTTTSNDNKYISENMKIVKQHYCINLFHSNIIYNIYVLSIVILSEFSVC